MMYLLSVLAIVVCFVLFQVLNRSAYIEYFDAMSILVLVVLIIPIMISSGLLKDLNRALRLTMGKNKEASMLEMKRAKLAVDTMIKVSIGSGVFVAVMQIHALLHYMSDPASIGPAISLALLTVLYAVVINLLLLPIRAKLEKRILEYMPSEPENVAEPEAKTEAEPEAKTKAKEIS